MSVSDPFDADLFDIKSRCVAAINGPDSGSLSGFLPVCVRRLDGEEHHSGIVLGMDAVQRAGRARHRLTKRHGSLDRISSV